MVTRLNAKVCVTSAIVTKAIRSNVRQAWFVTDRLTWKKHKAIARQLCKCPSSLSFKALPFQGGIVVIIFGN